MPEDGPDDIPTVSCSQCDHTWRLDYELEDLQVGNRAVEQFALDHNRHTGHYPDDVCPWTVDCERCPLTESFLSETPARRWARTHARHTRHAVTLTTAAGDTERVSPPDQREPED